MAEVIKYGAILDAAFFGYLERHRSKILRKDPAALRSIIGRCCTLKAEVVRRDEKESSYRRILNFGHTIGHALEGYFLTSGDKLFHGEAIAAGMIMESYIATRKGFISDKDLNAIGNYIIPMYGKIDVPEAGKWMMLIKQDKKNKGNTILMAFPNQIGKAVWDVPVSEKEIRDSIDYYRTYQT